MNGSDIQILMVSDLQGSDLESIQTVVTCLQATCDEILLRANTCNIVLYSEDDPSHLLHLEQPDADTDENTEKTTVEANSNNIQFHHIDGRAFHLKNVSVVKISNCDIFTIDNIDRKLSICEAVTCANVQNLSLENCNVTGRLFYLDIEILYIFVPF